MALDNTLDFMASFADIFFNNCFKNGLLPIVLPEPVISKLFDEVLAFPGFELTIDLQAQVVRGSQLGEVPFEVEAFRKHCLTNGLDDIGLTLLHTDKINPRRRKPQRRRRSVICTQRCIVCPSHWLYSWLLAHADSSWVPNSVIACAGCTQEEAIPLFGLLIG